jgi:hypothetical protein
MAASLAYLLLRQILQMLTQLARDGGVGRRRRSRSSGSAEGRVGITDPDDGEVAE